MITDSRRHRKKANLFRWKHQTFFYLHLQSSAEGASGEAFFFFGSNLLGLLNLYVQLPAMPQEKNFEVMLTNQWKGECLSESMSNHYILSTQTDPLPPIDQWNGSIYWLDWIFIFYWFKQTSTQTLTNGVATLIFNQKSFVVKLAQLSPEKLRGKIGPIIHWSPRLYLHSSTLLVLPYL